VYPWPRYKALDGCPPHQSMTNPSLPFPGSPRYRFPCFIGTMERCDSLRPSRRASFCFAWQYQVLASVASLPAVQNAQPRAWGSSSGPLTGTWHLETTRVSQVPGEPLCAYAVFFDPGGTDTPGHTGAPTRPSGCQQRRLAAGRTLEAQ